MNEADVVLSGVILALAVYGFYENWKLREEKEAQEFVLHSMKEKLEREGIKVSYNLKSRQVTYLRESKKP